MTLCAAWIRKTGTENGDELVFATDSCLSAGERWNTGIKLFDFQRKDCLICFSGQTYRAYPLIMNAIHMIKSTTLLSNPCTPLSLIKDEIRNLFTELSDTIYFFAKGENKEELRSQAQFLFGGWDYQNQIFKLWHMYYDKEKHKFVDNDIFFDDSQPAFFIGDGDEDAKNNLLTMLKKYHIDEDVRLDMEPFKILYQVTLNDSNTLVAGPIQLAKIYKSGSNEFFGVYSKDKPTFHGQEYSYQDKPPVRYIDPENSSIIIDDIPQLLMGVELEGKYEQFIKRCYPDNKYNSELNLQDKTKLIMILKELSYKRLLDDIRRSIEEKGTVNKEVEFTDNTDEARETNE